MLANAIGASPHNLVARGERSAVYERHVREAWAVGALLQPRPGTRWLDLGTGGGLPGLVLALQHPRARWTLLDATQKKIAAVTDIAAAASLGNVDTVVGRAEAAAWTTGLRGAFDGVVARAVAPLVTLVELARGFLAPDGILAAIKGPAWEQELAVAARALDLLRLEVVDTVAIPAAVRPTWVVTMRAQGLPPDGYPRRDGIPKQQPLGVATRG